LIEHRNTTVTARMVLRACESLGVDTDALLASVGIDRATAEDPDGEVGFEQMRHFWQTAYQMSGDPHLALRAGQLVKVGDYKCLDYLTVHAGTIGQSMENFCRYMLLLNTWIAWEIVPNKDTVTLRMLPAAGILPSATYEFVFTIYTNRVRHLTEDSWAPELVRLPFSMPAEPQIHADFFKAPVQYEAPAGEFVISMACWNRVLPSSDENLLRVLDEHARLLLEKRPLPDDFVGQVRREIVRDLHGGEVNRDNIASRLNMSPRTLQRRLDEHCLAFADLLDAVRADLAKNKLAGSDLSLAEVGFLLGFSDQSAFTRAFKRWTGKTPKEYRNRVNDQ